MEALYLHSGFSLCSDFVSSQTEYMAQDLTLTEQRQRESEVRVHSGSVSHGEGESRKTAYLRGAEMPRGKSSLHRTHTQHHS